MFPVPVNFNFFNKLRHNNLSFEKIYYIRRSGYHAVFFGQKETIEKTIDWINTAPKALVQYIPPISRVGVCERNRRYFIEYNLTQLEPEKSRDYRQMSIIRETFKPFNVRLKIKWSRRFNQFFIENFIIKR